MLSPWKLIYYICRHSKLCKIYLPTSHISTNDLSHAPCFGMAHAHQQQYLSKVFFSSKNLKQNHEIIYNDPFTINLHHFVDDNADA